MREILFRGKRIIKDPNADSEWIYGYISSDIYVDGIIGPVPMISMKLDGCNFRLHSPVYPDSVGQFTGKYDKNGEKVYEGDILSILGGEYRGVVMWSDHDQCYFISPNGDDHTTLGDFGDYGRKDYYEIIGNIYDNPELLEGGGVDGD